MGDANDGEVDLFHPGMYDTYGHYHYGAAANSVTTMVGLLGWL
jgi:hypothetical protein